MSGLEKLSSEAHFVTRPRVCDILDRAAKGRLVYVVAGAGYGKTQAVRDYIKRQPDAVVRWVQLTESDNVGARYWEHLTRNIAQDNPDLAEKLNEFGFPETMVRFKQFAEILRSTEHRSHKTFLVLDDFHLIHSKQALTFAERCAHLSIPGACVIIISRTEPDINAVALFAKGQATGVTEEELCFTEQEIADFFDKRGIEIPAKSLPRLLDATKGWALAIQLLSMVLKRTPVNIDFALNTVRQNVFKVMETEAWNDFSGDMQKTLVRLSMVSELPLKMLWNRFSDSPLPDDAPQLAPFIWSDSITGQDRVHPLYWDFLRSKQDILSDEEKQDTYEKAALFCFENNFYIDAVKYLAASHQFGQLLKIFLSYPHRLPPDTCKYFLEVLQSAEPDDNLKQNSDYLLLTGIFIPLLLSGLGKHEEAAAICRGVISQREHSDDALSLLLVSIAYSNLAYIDMYICTVSHKYNAPEYLKKSTEYSLLYTEKTSAQPAGITGAFAVADIRSFACLVGEGAGLREFDDFLDSAKLTAGYISDATQNMYYGYDDLVACEIAFYENRPEDAKRYAYAAILKARERNQHSIEAMAAMYLFRIAILEGNYPLIKELFRERDDNPGNQNFWNRKFLYELAIGLLFTQIGLPGRVPAWLIADDKDDSFDVSVPVRELICSAKYYISAKKYDRALTSLCNAYPRKPTERFLFGELTLSLLTAVARIKTGDTAGAVKDFEKAYELSCGGIFEIPFIELGRDLHPLITAVSDKPDNGIDEKWLRKTGRKASVYAKKIAVILNGFKADQKIEDTVELSQREMEILTDLYHGLSREEIAVNRYLSINTVHKIIQSIFLKLDAYGKADAIRIAIDKHLLE